MNNSQIVAKQLNRALSSRIKVIRHCQSGFPIVTKNAPVANDGAPFPTLYWLTCPALRKAISRLEAGGGLNQFEKELKEDPSMRDKLVASDIKYKKARDSKLPAGLKAIPGGIAGNSEVSRLKCLHAHAADWLANDINPVGKKVLELAPVPGGCDLCLHL